MRRRKKNKNTGRTKKIALGGILTALAMILSYIAGNCQYCHYIGIVSAWKRTGTACQSAADYADGGVIW